MEQKLPWRYVLGVLALALIIRLVAAVYLGNHVTGLSGAQDEVSYSMLAERFVTGHGLTFPKPWYPWIQANAPQSYYSATMSLYLAAIYKTFGYQPIIARIVTGVLSTLLVLMIILLANRLFGKPVALVAGVIASVYAYLIFYGVTLVTETPSILSLLAAIYLVYRIEDSPSVKKWVLLGVALAATILFRQATMFYVPLLLLWAVYRQQGPKKMVFIPIVIIVLFILPFTVRNYLLWHRFMLLEAQYGHVFWNGNYPGQHGNFVPDRVFPIPSAVLASHNDVEITNTLLFMGIDHVLKDPGGFALLTLSRLRILFTFWPTPGSSLLANAMRVLSFGILLPFALGGLVLSFRKWRELVPIYLFILVHTGVYSISWTMIRYRLPIDALIIPFGALAVVKLGTLLGQRVRSMPIVSEQLGRAEVAASFQDR